MTKRRIGIIFGGRSAEHEVSLQSAQNIVNAIDKSKFEVTLLGIDKNGHWHICDASNYLQNSKNPALISLSLTNKSIAIIPGKEQQQIIEANNASALAQLDAVFPMIHGTLGEDGSLQGLLRMANIPCVGSGVLGSAICMDKDVSKRLLRDAGFAVAPFITLNRSNVEQLNFQLLKDSLGIPLFIKPANQGSSVGISKVHDEASFKQALKAAFNFDHKVLVEAAIVGREIECAVLGNDNPQASVCGEIVLTDEFYSYETKYINPKGAKVVVPAELEPQISDQIRKLALKAFYTLDCIGMARVDVFLTPDNNIIINEVNTVPGFTNISMYPKLWESSGVSYSELITKLIELSFERHLQNQELKDSVF